MTDNNEDPYAVSSDSDEYDQKAPPPKINIEGRSVADISSLKAAITESKETVKDDARLEELNALKDKSDVSKIKKDFIEGKTFESNTEKIAVEERKKLFAETKEQYAKFKNAFEKMPETIEQDLEEKLKAMEKELTGFGKDVLANIKGAFENPLESQQGEREKIVIERSEADKKRIMSAFTKSEMTADGASRECAICSKVVYPVERIFVNKSLYHVGCFKCLKCAKRLTATNYNSHEGQILCKVHYLEVFHPELAKTMDPSTTEEEERLADDDEEEFAVSSRPKQLHDDVVRSGVKTVDDFSQITSLKDRRGDWESSANEATTNMEKKNLDDEIVAGKVKANLERFITGAATNEEYVDDRDEIERDPNIIREIRTKKEELKFDQVGDIKNRWKTGNVQGVDIVESGKEDLEDLKKGPGLKERFKERTEDHADDTGAVAKWDRNELDTSAAADARRSFVEGSAYETGSVERSKEDIEFKKLGEFKERFERGEGDIQVEKTAIDIQIEGLGDKKSAFEKGEEQMTPEERAEKKKREIEAEFLKYKLARRAAARRQAGEQVEGAELQESGIEVPEADVDEIKDRFEKGEAFAGQADGKSDLDVEIKMAGKAREKFKEIDAKGGLPVAPQMHKEKVASKWDKKESAAPEPINRRVAKDDDEKLEDEDAYDVKNLMNKFKNIENEPTKFTTNERRIDLEGIKVEARNLKDQFEKVGLEEDDSEEKRKKLEEEFAGLKAEKEAAAAAANEADLEDETNAPMKEDIQVAADHASKMTAKWEKIQKKEAKKAEKGKMPTKSSTHTGE